MNEQEMVGKHRAKARAWGFGKTNNGSIQIGIEFDFLDIPGKTMPYYGSFSGNATEHTLKAMRACGWAGEDLTDLTGLDTNEVSLTVDWDEYQGKRTLKVKWVNPAGGIGFKERVDVAELADFAFHMIPVIKATNPGTIPAPEHRAVQQVRQAFGGGGQGYGAPSNYGAPPQRNDDIPF